MGAKLVVLVQEMTIRTTWIMQQKCRIWWF